MKKLFFSFFCLLALTCAAGSPAAIWEVRHPDRPGVLYLAGTIHLGKPEMYPLDSVYDRTFADADYLMFEVLDQQIFQSAAFIMRNGLYPAEVTDSLSEKMGEREFEKLAPLVPTIRKDKLIRMKPWVAMLMVQIEPLRRAGFREELGFERVFQNAGKAKNVPMLALEEPISQLRILASAELEEECIKTLLDDVRDPKQTLRETLACVKGLQSGTSEPLPRLLEEMHRDYPKIYKFLIVDRNRAIAKKLSARMATSGKGMILIGLAHYCGPDSVQKILQREGCTIRQLERTGKPGAFAPVIQKSSRPAAKTAGGKKTK